jgi:hypothetical protein
MTAWITVTGDGVLLLLALLLQLGDKQGWQGAAAAAANKVGSQSCSQANGRPALCSTGS